MRFLGWNPLPTDKLPKSDPRYQDALYGDAMIRLTRWLRFSAPLVGIGIAAIIAWIASRTWHWVFALMPLGFVVYMFLAVSKPRVPWHCDYRAPLLVLRSFTDERSKLGDQLPYGELPAAGDGQQNPYIWQISEALWDCCRVIFLGEEPNLAQLEVFGIAIQTTDNWQQAMLKIARSAWAIMVFPATTPSCLEEMALLRDSGLLNKTIVIMPPNEWTGLTRIIGTVLGYGGLEHAKHAESWDALKTEMSKYGYHFPPYDAAGEFYVPTTNFAPQKVIKLNHSLKWKPLMQAVPGPGILQESLQKLLNGCNAFENDRRQWGKGGL
jgi:hypothetical protein